MQSLTDPPTAGPRALSARAVLIALVLVAIGVVLLHHHDGNITRRNVVSQNVLAPIMVGLMFFFTLLINGLLRRIRRGWGLEGAEMAVVGTLLLLGAPLARYYSYNWIGTVGYTRALMANRDRSMRDFFNANPYEVLPDGAMLTEPQSQQFLASLAAPGELADATAIPWGEWVGPMSYWLPLMLVFMVLCLSLAYTLYRQWAHRELVPFPLAEFVASMVENRRGRAFPDIFYNRLFWIGVGLMVFIFGVNGLHMHFTKMIRVPVSFSYYLELLPAFPFLENTLGGPSLLRGWFYFLMIAVAVMLPKEISFTSWVSWPVMVLTTYIFYVQTGSRVTGPQLTMFHIGAFLGMAILIIYAGRSFYLGVCRRSVGLSSREVIDGQSLWAFRIFALSAVAMVYVLYTYGIPLDLGILWVVFGIIYLLILCRLVAEMGIPWLPVRTTDPTSVIVMVFGERVLGPRIYAAMAIVTSMVLPQHATMLPLAPAAVNAIRIEDRVSGRNASAKITLPFMLGVLVISFATLIYFGYTFQGQTGDVHAANGLNDVKEAAQRIYQMAGLESASAVLQQDVPMMQRWGQMQMPSGFLPISTFGLVVVLAVGMLRLKLPRFPLHPLPFVLLGTWLLSRYVFPFFLGWLIKIALVKIGGGPLFEKARPFFIGIVVGQAVIASIWVVANIMIFWYTGATTQFHLEWYRILPEIYSS